MKKGMKLCGLFAALATWGASGAWAGDGVVALQTADPSCADPTNSDRYIDCGNGTVTDNDTGLVWLQNANCIGSAGDGTGDPPGKVDWYTAMEFVAGLSDHESDDCGLEDGSSPGEWRLASKAEWQAMVVGALGEGGVPDCTASGPTITNDAGTDCWADDCVTAGACSFTGVVPGGYWASTTTASNTALARFITLASGFPFFASKVDGSLYVWPVRGGQ
jgi:hypothetical protein